MAFQQPAPRLPAPAISSPRRPVSIAVLVAVLVAIVTAGLRMLVMAGFSNDHFFYLSRASQVLLGDWPVRDFMDPGFPLAILVSTAAQAIGGHTLFAEALLVAAAFGIAAGLTVWIVQRWTQSWTLALWAAFVEVAVLPRSYSYPKILVYLLAAAAFGRYVRTPGFWSIVQLAAVTVVAFLFRHDHGAYIGTAACVLVALTGHATGWRAAVHRVAWLAVVTLALLAPYFLYVHDAAGLARYFAEALAYSERDALRTMVWPPRLDGAAPGSPDGLSVVAYYVFWIVPILTLAVATVSRRLPAASRWTAAAVAIMALLMNTGLLRDPLRARIPDAVVPFVLLTAWLAAQTWRSAPRVAALRWIVRAAAIVVLLVTAFSAAIIGNFRDELARAELWRLPPRPLVRWQDVSTQLREPFAERQMPSDLAFSLVPFYRYVQACTPPAARILVTGYAPEIAYYARRGFAGGYPSIYRGYFSSTAEQRTTIARLEQALTLFVVHAPEEAADFADSFPLVSEYVGLHFVPLATIAVDGEDAPAEIYINRAIASAPPYGTTPWPCPWPQPPLP